MTTEWLTAAEAAEQVGMVTESIRKYIRDGSVPTKELTRLNARGHTYHPRGVRIQDVIECRDKYDAERRDKMREVGRQAKEKHSAKVEKRNREIREEEWPHFRSILGPEMAVQLLAQAYGMTIRVMRETVGVDAQVAA